MKTSMIALTAVALCLGTVALGVADHHEGGQGDMPPMGPPEQVAMLEAMNGSYKVKFAYKMDPTAEEWTESEALRVHMECVALCMAAYADIHAPQEKSRWFIAGLLHDFDYEKHPTLDQHPQDGVAWLKENTDLDDDLLATILAHAPHTGEPRDMNAVKEALAKLG